MKGNWWESEWFKTWVRLAQQSNGESYKRRDWWLAFYNAEGKLVYKYVKNDD
jgi:hypothetical protein